MSDARITQTVNRILELEFEVQSGQIRDEALLFDDLGLDSLDAVDLIVSLEAAFDGRVPEAEAKKVKTVADVYALIETHVLTPSV